MSKTDRQTLVSALSMRDMRFLLQLLRTASITQAGALLDLSQPAASRTMMRLRKVFGDPLLVRTRQGFGLTLVAQRLAEPLDQAMQTLDGIMAPEPFAPATTQRVFRLCSTDYGIVTVITPLLDRLAKQAPGVALRCDPWGSNTLERLEQGRVDFALYADAEVPAEFHSRTLFREHYVLMGPAHHPVFKTLPTDQPLGKAELARTVGYRQVAVRYPSGLEHTTDDILRRAGLPAAPLPLELPYFHLALRAMTEAGLLGILPARLAEQGSALDGLVYRPLALPQLSFDYRLIWHARTHHDSACQWLRQRVAERGLNLQTP